MLRRDWLKAYKRALKFVPAMKSRIGQCMLHEVSMKVTKQEVTDLVLETHRYQFGTRVRKPNYFDRWGNELTLRVRPPKSRFKSEFDKVLEGCLDYFFYCHSRDEENHKIGPWMLIDMHKFRKAWNAGMFIEGVTTGIRDNGDGTWFRWFKITPKTRFILKKVSKLTAEKIMGKSAKKKGPRASFFGKDK